MAEVINAPTLKHHTAEVMVKTGKGINDENMRRDDERRKKAVKDHSMENFERHLKYREDLRKGSYERVDRDYVPEHAEDVLA